MMTLTDNTRVAAQAILAHRLRTLLILIAMAIGVASVILLTGLGETARRYITGEFAALGTNLLIVLPGRSETTGGPPPLLGTTPRDLTLADAEALLRSPYIERVAPVMVGAIPVSSREGLERDVNLLGTTAAMLEVRHLTVANGRFLPAGPADRASPVCVLGHKLKQELFGSGSVIGEWLRAGDRRYRIIGVLSDEGTSIGVDFNDLIIIPVASAQALFDRASLFRILAEAKGSDQFAEAAADIRRIITDRHEGEDDVTIITQDSVIETFDKILSALTYGIAGIAAISLVVAGILIMNVMLVSVTQRTQEIGLWKALGSSNQVLMRLFLTEAIMLSASGALLGVGLGLLSIRILQRMYPDLPIATPLWSVAAALVVALITGLMFGVVPARRAARMDPVLALSQRH